MINSDNKQINLAKNAARLFAVLIIAGGFAINTFAAPPSNDNFANAEIVSGIQIHLTRTNIEATKEPSEPNHANNAGGKSVWFKWTAPMSRVMSVTTNRSANNLNTLLHIYGGAALGSLINQGSNNDINSPADLRSFVRFRAVQGTTYYIAVDGFSESGQTVAEGSFFLDIQPSFEFQGADYDSDGMTDLSFFRPSDGTWNVFNSSSEQITTRRWGASGDIPLVFSNAGSGVNEYTVYRPSDNIWYNQPVCCTDNTYTSFGASGDIPAPANFGGGENTEIAVFRPSSGIWFINGISVNPIYYYFGQSGDLPVPGHFSPDPFADIAVFRPSNGTWYFIKRISNNSGGDTFNEVRFGQPGDKPVAADYDGDGILDVAIFRPSTGVWWVLRSSDNQFQAFQWGVSEDIPATGDFDGDGKFDYAVFRPSSGVWYVFQSSDNSIKIKQFGASGDIPVTANRTF